MAVKPSGSLTPNVAHPLCPDLALVCHEGSGNPANLGKFAVSAPILAAGSLAWDSDAAFGNFIRPSAAKVTYGTADLLGGLTKATFMFAIGPDTWAQNAGIFGKQTNWNNSHCVGIGLTNAGGQGNLLGCNIGRADGADASELYFVRTPSTLVMAQWGITVDLTQGAQQKIKFYRDNAPVALFSTQKDDAGQVFNARGSAINLATGTCYWWFNMAPFAGAIGYVYCYRDKVLTADERTELFHNPYIWINEALPVVYLAPAAGAATYKRTRERATITVGRLAADISGDLTVELDVGGTAVADTDYAAINSRVTIPGGSASVDIIVAPAGDPGVFDYDKTIALAPAADAAYTTDPNPAITVTVQEFHRDLYGGLVGANSPIGASGHYRVERINGRWLSVSPLGNYMWMFGVQESSLYQAWDEEFGKATNRFYGRAETTTPPWGLMVPHWKRRLWAWGFTGFTEFGGTHFLPIPFASLGTVVTTPAGIGLPFVNQLQPTHAWRDYGASTGADKMLEACLRPASLTAALFNGTFNGDARITFADVFHPTWAAWAHNLAADVAEAPTANPQWPTATGSPWPFSLGMDDTDQVGILKHSNHPHLAWLAAIGNPGPDRPAVAGDARGGWSPVVNTGTHLINAGYGDVLKTSYTKLAWIQFCKDRYGTIIALNAAWNTGWSGSPVNYTGFDSVSWPRALTGSNVLADEDGSSPWFGGTQTTANIIDGAHGWPPAAARDLSDFLVRIMAEYLSHLVTGRDQTWPGVMLTNWDPLDLRYVSFVNFNKGAILDAITTFCDYATLDGYRNGILQPAFYTDLARLGDFPFMSFVIGSSNADSDYRVTVANSITGSASPQTLTPINNSYIWDAVRGRACIGETLIVGPGTANEEQVVVLAGTATTFTAVFTKGHAGPFDCVGLPTVTSFPTNEAWGADYASMLEQYWKTKQCIGISWFALADPSRTAFAGEKTAWGLISHYGNAKDGKQNTTSPHGQDTDPDGYAGTPELYDNGDLLTAVRNANFQIMQNILDWVIEAKMTAAIAAPALRLLSALTQGGTTMPWTVKVRAGLIDTQGNLIRQPDAVTHRLYRDGVKIQDVSQPADGPTEFTLTIPEPEIVVHLGASALDAAGNESPVTPLDLPLDSVAPAAPAFKLVAATWVNVS